MSARSRALGRLLITYLAVTEALHVLWTGRFSTGPEIFVKALVVPALQMTVLECARRVVPSARGSFAADAVARFLGRWLILGATLASATLTIDYLVSRRVDLTAPMFLALLVTPTIQSAVLGDPAKGAPLALVWRTVRRHPLVTPVLMLDAVLLLALIGVSDGAGLQRRWMATKLLAAALVFSLWPARDQEALDPGHGRRLALGLGVILAGIAFAIFAPALVGTAARLLATVTGQPLAILLLESYAGTFVMVAVMAIALRRRVAAGNVVACDLLGWGTLALFMATLTLLMNGFVSTQAVRPWAGLAVASGSVAASCLLVASLLLTTRQVDA